MGGQVLGGGVIVLVAVLLWLVYLLPTWHSRRQFDAAERNAVRLNQALRVLAETSETPEEVRLELNARTALAQQRLARRAIAERERAALDDARIDLERARDERAAARTAPAARRARARRRTRLLLTVAAIAAIALAGYGTWNVLATGSQLPLWAGVGTALLSGLLLQRMRAVGARVGARAVLVHPAERVSGGVQDVALPADHKPWAPRALPRPLTASAGSRAAAVLDAEDAREALRSAAVEESMRQRAAALRPASIDSGRAPRRVAEPRFALTGDKGGVDDAEIEAHVRALLRSRATG